MEAIAGLSLAANILQVVDFSASLLSSANEIRKNGSTARNSELESLTVDLCNLNDDLVRSCRPYSKEDQDLHNLAVRSSKSADELIALLSKLQTSKHSGKFESVSAAIKTMWNKDKIDDANERLKNIRSQVMLRVTVSIKSKIDMLALKDDKIFLSFDDAKKEIIAAVLDDRQSVEAHISGQTAAIPRRHDETDALLRQTIQGQHNQHTVLTPEQVTTEIIKYLAFDTMKIRHEDIADNHLATFEWVFGEQRPDHSPTSNRAGADFGSWLANGEGTYWVSGKAGSGKSTLMKLIADNPRTRQIAKAWAKGQPLLFAPFYFWIAGTELQRTQNGLYRSIVLKTLNTFPDLAQSLFPYQFSKQASWNQFPTTSQLKHAFRSLISQEAKSFKILLLVDGLDEYEGNEADMFELAETFKAATCSSVKAILSSRPLQAFEDAFASCPKLRLHELTFQDISAYTDGKLKQHPRMIELTREDPKGTEELVNEVVSSASGVFLWVKLVLRSLLEGLRNFDDISDLAVRLSEMPRDLEALFQHMLSKIEPRYLAQSSQFFQIFRCAQDSWSKIHRTGSLMFSLTAVTLAYTGSDTEVVLNAKIGPLDPDDEIRLIAQTDARLKSRCAGLLELRSSESDNSSIGSSNYIHSSGGRNTWAGPEVRLLHKSVADFLYKPAVWSDILSHTRNTNFNPGTLLLKSIILWFKSFPLTKYDLETGGTQFVHPMRPSLCFAAEVAKQAELSSHQSQGKILGELDRVVGIHLRPVLTHAKHWADLVIRSSYDKLPHSFLTFAISQNLVLYVQEELGKLEGDKSWMKGMYLLHRACYWESIVSGDMVRLLLRFGVDPNECYKSLNSLQWLMKYQSETIHSMTYALSEGEDLTTITQLLLEHGVDTNCVVDVGEERGGATSDWIWRYSVLYFVRCEILKELPAKPGMSYQWKEPTWDKPDARELLRLIESKGGKATAWVGARKEGDDSAMGRTLTQAYPIPIAKSEEPGSREPEMAKRKKPKRAYVKKLLSNKFGRKA